jgi:hypothetical protein
LIEPAPSNVPEHPFDAEGFELSDDDAREMATNSAKLHELPEFRSWLPSRTAVDEMLAHVGEHLTPNAQPEQSEIAGLLEKEIQASTDRLFSPQLREQLVRTMKDSALSVLAREGEAKTLEVVAAMKRIAAAGLITDPPHEIGFLRGFFDKALAILLAQGQGRLNIPVRQQAGANGDGGTSTTDATAPTAAAGEAAPQATDSESTQGAV